MCPQLGGSILHSAGIDGHSVRNQMYFCDAQHDECIQVYVMDDVTYEIKHKGCIPLETPSLELSGFGGKNSKLIQKGKSTGDFWSKTGLLNSGIKLKICSRGPL